TVVERRVQVMIEGIGHGHSGQRTEIARILLQYARVYGVQFPGVMLMTEIQKVGERSYEAIRQLPLQIDVEAVIVGLLEVLRIPQQVLAPASDVSAQGLAGNRTKVRQQRIGGCEWIGERRLRYA